MNNKLYLLFINDSSRNLELYKIIIKTFFKNERKKSFNFLLNFFYFTNKHTTTTAY